MFADTLEGDARRDVEARAVRWLAGWRAHVLGPLARLAEVELTPPGRGLAFQLFEGLGWLERRPVEAQVANLAKADRQALAAAGFRIGRLAIWAPALFRGRAQKARRLMARLAGGDIAETSKRQILLARPETPNETTALARAGFVMLGRHALRIDVAERLAGAAHSPKAPGTADALAERHGLPAEALPALLNALGFRPERQDDGPDRFVRKRARPGGRRAARPSLPPVRADSPFAVLKDLARG